MIYENLKYIFKKEFSISNKITKVSLASNVSLINEINKYLELKRGKQIRSFLAFIFGNILNCEKNKFSTIASVVELVHTATLVHDDIVDNSKKRRGKLSINYAWSNKDAVLVGDFLYTKSFEIIMSLENINIVKFIATTTNLMSEGEVLQLINRNNTSLTEQDYFKIIKCKTAALFAFSSSASAIITNSDNKIFKKSFSYGYHFGITYQLIDDILDYTCNNKFFGKTRNDDLSNGTLTLPAIYLIKNNYSYCRFISKILSNIRLVNTLVKIDGGADHAFDLAHKNIIICKESMITFKYSKYINYMKMLLDTAITRQN